MEVEIFAVREEFIMLVQLLSRNWLVKGVIIVIIITIISIELVLLTFSDSNTCLVG